MNPAGPARENLISTAVSAIGGHIDRLATEKQRVLKIVAIAAGGSLGAVLRFLVAKGVHRVAGDVFPFGTLTVNILGCLIFGIVYAMASPPNLIREELRLALLVGFVGAFTTFSTFGFETIGLAIDRQLIRAAVYVVTSNVLGIGAVWLGIRFANRFLVGA